MAAVAIPFASCGGGDSDSTQPSTGWLATGIGDVDGDGFGDLALSCRFHPVTEADDYATWILSGREGRPLYTIRREPSRADAQRTPPFGKYTPAGYQLHPIEDQDGDELGDLCVSFRSASNYREERRVFLSGKDGHTISGKFEHWRSSHPSQWQHRSIGDADGDRIDDYVDNIRIRAQGEQPTSVEVFSGRTFERLFSCSIDPRCEYMHAFHTAGDVDGDRVSEIALSGDVDVDMEGKRCKPAFGVVTVHSGKDGSLLRTYDREYLSQLAAHVVPNVVIR